MRLGYRYYDYGKGMERPEFHPHTWRELKYKGYEVDDTVDRKYDCVTDTTNWRCVRIEW